MKVSQLLYKEDLLEDIKYKGDINIIGVKEIREALRVCGI